MGSHMVSCSVVSELPGAHTFPVLYAVIAANITAKFVSETNFCGHESAHVCKQLTESVAMGELLLKSAPYFSVNPQVAKLEEDNHALRLELEELSALHRQDLQQQYMKIHAELGDQISELKQKHRHELTKLQDELNAKELRIQKQTESQEKLKKAFQTYRREHFCIRLRSSTFRQSFLANMDKLVTLVLDICISSYG